jgi:hypothetical protein
MHASCIREASLGRNRPCWHVVVVQLDGHHSFLANVEALVALIEQINASAADFHMLFVGRSLFEMLAKDETSHWHAAIKGYLRYTAGKVIQIIYGARFVANFFGLSPSLHSRAVVNVFSGCRRPSGRHNLWDAQEL